MDRVRRGYGGVRSPGRGQGPRPTEAYDCRARSLSAPWPASDDHFLMLTQRIWAHRVHLLTGSEAGEVAVRSRKHLGRLDTISIPVPVYFITVCVANRRPLLANPDSLKTLRSELEAAPRRYGWTVGRFVVMPDH